MSSLAGGGQREEAAGPSWPEGGAYSVPLSQARKVPPPSHCPNLEEVDAPGD